MAKEKVYVGSGKIKTFENGGSVINISLKIADLPDSVDGKYINLTVAERREPDKYGFTHTVYVNDFVPKKSKEEDSSLPF